MTRPGYVPRPTLPCADSVALMSASPEALRIVGRDSYALGAPLTSFWAGTAGARKIRNAARRLMLYPWFFEAHAPEVQAEIKMWTFAASRYQEIG